MAKKRKQHSPTVRLSLPTATIYAGSPVTIGIAVNDVDGNLASGSLQWGDGASVSWTTVAPTSLTHTYAAAGSYSIRATVQDTLGMIGSTTASITVQPPTPLPSVFQTDLIEAGPGSGTTGQALGYSATAKFSDGTQQNVTGSAAWLSTNTAVATVAAGAVTTIAAGTTIIRSSYGGYTKDITLTVSAPAPTPPAIPNSPSPADLATGISLTPTLHWASAGADTYAVAFGLVNPPPTVTTGLGTTAYQPGSLTPSTVYFWQITATNSGGSTVGPVWRFTTQAAALTPSPDPTFVPPSSQIVDNSLNVWTLGPVQPNGFYPILKNGVQAGGAFGAKIEWCGGQIYIQGDDTPAAFYRWDAGTSGWVFVSNSDPCVTPPPPPGPTVYIATTGNDTTGDGTIGNPWRTFNRAVPTLTPGMQLLARGGTYDETLQNLIPSGTSWTNKVRIAAYPGETVWLTPSSGGNVVYCSLTCSYIEWDGINIDSRNCDDFAFQISPSAVGDPHHIRIQNCELIGSTKTAGLKGGVVMCSYDHDGSLGGNEFLHLTIHGGGTVDSFHAMYISTPNTLVDGCTLYDWAGAALHFHNSYGRTFAGIVARNNRIGPGRSLGAGQRHWGIITSNGCIGAAIYNNVVFGVPNDGSTSAGLYDFAGDHVQWLNNTVADCAGEGLVIESGVTAAAVTNNIGYNNAGGNYRKSGTVVSELTNLFGTNPLFVNQAGHDYHLQAGSPGVDTGTTVSLVATDLDDVSRPQGAGYDTGAYER